MESNMTFAGFLTFCDPPKLSTAETIKRFHKKGIKMKVLTGVNPF